MDSKTLLHQMVITLLPREIYLHFELVSIEEHIDRIEFRLEEYSELVPEIMRTVRDVVLDGFCNPIELLHHSYRDKPLYLKLYRRRWKSSGSKKAYSNSYDLHPEGVKATHSFASFLKEEVGLTPDEYIRCFIDTGA